MVYLRLERILVGLPLPFEVLVILVLINQKLFHVHCTELDIFRTKQNVGGGGTTVQAASLTEGKSSIRITAFGPGIRIEEEFEPQ